MSDKPAFPIPGMDMQYLGLTKRELFAMSAMQAIIGWEKYESGHMGDNEAANRAAGLADALIKALEVGGE